MGLAQMIHAARYLPVPDRAGGCTGAGCRDLFSPPASTSLTLSPSGVNEITPPAGPRTFWFA